MIRVTKAFVPPMSEYVNKLNPAFEMNHLTNRGQLVLDLEERLKSKLNVPHLTLTTNGTLPMQIAIKVMELKGEIITTPFSYVATTAVIAWENCTPVFVDIDPEYLTIDEEKIEAAITEKTSAILATHVFGNPCNVEKINKIAENHNLKVIYDAAHCFGVNYKGKSIFNYGDVSTCSFHATKIFHTGEGGCWVTKDKELQEKLYYHHNFGHDGPLDFHGLGINAKMSELQAAMGLAVLDHFDNLVEKRKKVVDFYNRNLNLDDIDNLNIREHTEWNYHYYPVLFQSEDILDRVLDVLNRNNIFPRRYFYPSLNTLPYVKPDSCPIAENISSRILCLPLYHDILEIELKEICDLINSTIKA